ncbi:hypothetical protein LTR56_022554 [Elasticomyces elasticus]|nr:hypothetical protein LTR22_027253 [Elasticomyces elasticus]KAK3621818.1 hypothetical protein LTR56_022554 [Elasticomyces elasticus]KAK4898299.1 hypothetical protein LTR49_027846 [Elasticomyces elasticus]KAK5733956.1 hypothetical protein LTS12_026819 [Elasticomyces elasticus]
MSTLSLLGHTSPSAAMSSSRPSGLDHTDDYYLDLDVKARDLVDSVKVIRAYGCTRNSHDPKRLCTCPKAMRTLTEKDKLLFAKLHWNLEWEQLLIKTDAAFSYTIDSAFHDAGFLHATGSSPETFARQFAEDTFAAPAMVAPLTSVEECTRALLVFWSKRAARWRTKHGDVQTTQTQRLASRPGDPGHDAWPDESAQSLRFPPQPGKHLKLQRFRVKGGSGHQSMIFILPLRSTSDIVGDTRFTIVGVRPCHERCSKFRVKLTDSFLYDLLRTILPRIDEAVLRDHISAMR